MIKKATKKAIEQAAKIIKRGGLVAFPTETVYGLGANALDKTAVRKIFKAKKRPMDNPLIIHIADIKDLNSLVKEIPKTAEVLIKKFWPGPLTLILHKKEVVPDEVTAGLKVVAIRIPKNRIALDLIKKAGVPIAAPSANLAGRPSPTLAQHVFDDLGAGVDLILDGGSTKIGVESTVVDLTVNPPQILRPGGISFEELKKVIKNIQLFPGLLGKHSANILKSGDKVKSPGMKYRHYTPKAPLILASGRIKEMTLKIQNLIKKYEKQNKKIGVLASVETKKFYKEADLILSPGSRKNLEKVAKNLFKNLREFDKRGVDIILAEIFSEMRARRKPSEASQGKAKLFSSKGIGFAIMHRLKKAAIMIC